MNEEKKDWKVIIMTCIMIFALCVLCFGVGYYMDQSNKVNQANKAIVEFEKTYPCIWNAGGQEIERIDGINFTWFKETE